MRVIDARSAGSPLKSLAVVVVAACGDNRLPDLPDAAPGALQLRFDPIALDGELEAITELDFIPGSTGELLVANKSHTVVHYRLDGDRAVRLGSFDVPGVDETSDCGLLSTAFDPDFATNHLIYFAFCDSPTHSRITRHVFDPDDYGSIARTTALVIRAGEDNAPKAWHNIGSIGFDPAGNLWALLGDKEDAPTAQNLAEPLGSVIRIVPDRVNPGFMPAPNNPFAGMPAVDPAIAAYGLRSPWRGALDDRGRLWIGDVGDSHFEEVNVSHFAGENFASGIVEGPCESSCTDLVDPVVYWDRSISHPYSREDPDAVQTQRRVVWVGTSYPKSVAIDRYATRMFDRMLVGDFAGGWVRIVGLDDHDAVIADAHVGHLEAASSWSVGPDGYLYVVTYGSALAFPYLPGKLYRAVASP